jgi:DUF4097 and DUF4098 domain-containing protein YvlB
MKTITGILITYALVFPPAPAAAQGDLGRQVERIVSSALTLAADALDDLVDERDPRAARQRSGDRNDRGPEYTEKFEKTVKIGRNGRLELTNYSGDVEVTGGTGEDIKITATKVTHATSEQTARAALSAMTIDVTERPGVVTVAAQPTRGRSNGVEVNYVIAVPAGTSVELRTFSGDVTIRNVSGGDVRLKSYSGDVVVRDGKLTGIEIDCTSGDVAIEQVESDRVQVSSLSGDIVYKGKLSKSGRYDLRSNSGDLQVVTDGGASFNVQAATFSGDVASDFPMKLGNIPSSFAGGRGARRNNDITGVVNDGGAQLSLHSLSGDILITKR